MVDKKSRSLKLAKRLGRNIAVRRKQLAWTQDQLAERVGVDAETISRFERGAHLPSLPTLDRLAVAMQMQIGDLTSESALPTDDDTAMLSAWLHDLSSDNRRFVINLVRESCEHLRKKK